MKVCVISDNKFALKNFLNILDDKKIRDLFDFYYSPANSEFAEKYRDCEWISPISLKNTDETFYSRYDLFLSLHCKQIFPKDLVDNHRCINVHPGFNPYNKGAYPHVFSILNKMPAGVTIHEMTSDLDGGPIIAQEQLEIHRYETSSDVYSRILELENIMLRSNIDRLLTGEYTAFAPLSKGNIHYKSDFKQLCALDLNERATFGEFLDLLRATTFDGCDNAYFLDEEQNRVYVSIRLNRGGYFLTDFRALCASGGRCAA